MVKKRGNLSWERNNNEQIGTLAARNCESNELFRAKMRQCSARRVIVAPIIAAALLCCRGSDGFSNVHTTHNIALSRTILSRRSVPVHPPSKLAAIPGSWDDIWLGLETAKSAADAELIKEAGEEVLGTLGQDVLTFLAATVAVVPLSRWLRVTPVLGFLIAGFLMGPNCLGFFANSEADLQLGDFGILFLLFSEGLNLSPERIRDLGAFYGLGVLQILVSMAILFFGIILGGPYVLGVRGARHSNGRFRLSNILFTCTGLLYSSCRIIVVVSVRSARPQGEKVGKSARGNRSSVRPIIAGSGCGAASGHFASISRDRTTDVY